MVNIEIPLGVNVYHRLNTSYTCKDFLFVKHTFKEPKSFVRFSICHISVDDCVSDNWVRLKCFPLEWTNETVGNVSILHPTDPSKSVEMEKKNLSLGTLWKGSHCSRNYVYEEKDGFCYLILWCTRK